MNNAEHWFYVLYSLKDHKLYKGVCEDVGKRFLAHSFGATTSTKQRRPLTLIYLQSFETKSEALAFERYSKSLEGGVELRQKLLSLGILDENGKLMDAG
jgi:putative endonuclease